MGAREAAYKGFKTWIISCDDSVCGTEFDANEAEAAAAYERAAKFGWTHGAGRDLCPMHTAVAP